MARYVPSPASTIQRKRPTGAVSSISMRPSDSSDAQPPTRPAAANPAKIVPSWTKSTWSANPGSVRSAFGNARRMTSSRVGVSAMTRARSSADTAMMKA